MEDRIKLSYFYGREADQYSFYKIPKLLFTEEYFKKVSVEAKVLYGLMLDRMSLSMKNQWFDTEGRAYIYYSLEDIMDAMGCSNKKAISIMKELDIESGIGLIEKKRQGQGKPTMIYLKQFMIQDAQKCNNYISGEKSAISEVKNLHSRSVETTPQEMKNVHGSNLNINNPEYSNPNMSLGKATYGTFQNVFLADDEVVDLKEILLNHFENYIERLSTYIQSTGKNYKDHKATILSWFYKDQGGFKQTIKAKSYSLEDYEMGDYL